MNASVITQVLSLLIPMLTPEIKAELVTVLDRLQAMAKATPNPYDDIAVYILRTVLGL
jgi:hypothetical protein